MPTELLNFFTQGALSVIFFYLYWKTNQGLEALREKYDVQIARLYELRITEIREFVRIPTNLGEEPSGVESASNGLNAPIRVVR